MKLTAIILFSACLSASANGFSQKITLNEENVPIQKIFREIWRQSGLQFVYTDQTLKGSKPVTVHVKDAELDEVLKRCFQQQPFTFAITDNAIVVKKKEEDFAFQAGGRAFPASPIDIHGRVLDEKGNPVVGATVRIKGSNGGTSTDQKGEFTLNSPGGGGILEISYVGYKTQLLSATGQKFLQVFLQPNTNGLNEIVVVGYGEQKRRDVTGTISTVREDDLKNIPASNAATALQGRASGVDIIRDDGSPGSIPSIRIRGTGTINNSDPLIVIDGVPSGSLNDVNPNDIASIEILKDASSSAIYGARAANGVVLITTKKGRFGEPLKITVNAYTGSSKILKYLNLLTAPELYTLKREAFTNDGLTIPAIWTDSATYGVQRTDWQRALMGGTGKVNNADLAIRGGNANSNYSFSGNYYDEKGLITNSYFKRYSARFNSEHKLGGRIRVGENFQYSSRSSSSPDTRSSFTGLVWSALRFNPAIPVMNADSTWGSSKVDNELGDINNPVYTATVNNIYNTNTSLLANAYLEIELVKGLKVRGNLGYDNEANESYNFSPATPDQTRVQSLDALTRGHTEYSSLLNEIYLTYDGQIGEDHHLVLTGGYSAQSSKGYEYNAQRDGFSDVAPNQLVLNNGSGANQYATGGSGTAPYIPAGLLSYFARGNYAYKEKYLLTATMRADGSSKFPPGKRWGYFPAFSLGWRVSDENFFKKNVSFISSLKLTGGWGQLGNQNVADFQYLGIIQTGNQYSFGAPGTVVNASYITTLPNPNITWERAEMTNISVDFGLLKDHLTGVVTYFNKDTRDMLIPASVVETYGAPPSIGGGGNITVPDQNQGTLNNHGVEVELTYHQTTGKLHYSLGVDATFLSNRVTYLYGTSASYIGSVFYGRESLETSRTYAGQPIASFYGFKTGGLYQTQADIDKDPNIANDPNKPNIKPGDVRFLDINGDGIVDNNDRVNLGNPNPKFTFGFHGNLEFEGFDLSFNFAGQTGSHLYNADRMAGLDATQVFNWYGEQMNRWHGPGTSNSIPRVSRQNLNNNYRSSDLWIQSGNYLSLKTLSLGYTFPKRLVGGIQLPEARVYVSSYNTFMLTGYKGYTPELGYTDVGTRQRGVDVAQYPSVRSFTVGATFNF